MATNDGYWQRFSSSSLSRRRLLGGGAGLGAAAVASALVGCGGDDAEPGAAGVDESGSPRPGGTLTLTFAGGFGGVDPHNAIAGGANLVPMGYNYLLRTSLLAPQEGVVQDLAESQELAADRVTTVFKLRPNVMINSNGSSVAARPLDAEDVKLSFERIMDPRNAANGFAWMNEWVEKMDAPDERTFRIVTKAPYAWVLNNAGNNLVSAIAPREWLASPQLRAAIVGGGPLVLKELTEGVQATMERNLAYWRKDRPYLDRYDVKVFTDIATHRTAFLAGQVDEYGAASPDEAKELLRSRKDVVHYKNPTLSGLMSFWMNTRIKPWDDSRVRRAVLRATNRDEYIQLIGRGAGNHVGLVSPFLQGYALEDGDLKKLQPFDLQEARRLFEAAAVKEFVFTYPATSNVADYVTIFSRQMAAAGVTVKAEPLDLSAWVGAMFQSKLPASLNLNQEYANPDLFLHWHTSRGITGAGNYDTGFSDPEIDAAVKKAAGALDETARKTAYLEAQRQILSKDPAVFFLVTKEQDLLQAKALKGVHRGVGSMWTAFAPDYWLDRA